MLDRFEKEYQHFVGLVNNEAAFIKEMLNLFLDKAKEGSKMIDEEIEKLEHQNIADLSHKMKSTTQSFADEEMRSKLKRLEESAKNKASKSEIIQLKKEMDEDMSQLLKFIQEKERGILL